MYILSPNRRRDLLTKAQTVLGELDTAVETCAILLDATKSLLRGQIANVLGTIPPMIVANNNLVTDFPTLSPQEALKRSNDFCWDYTFGLVTELNALCANVRTNWVKSGEKRIEAAVPPAPQNVDAALDDTEVHLANLVKKTAKLEVLTYHIHKENQKQWSLYPSKANVRKIRNTLLFTSFAATSLSALVFTSATPRQIANSFIPSFIYRF